MTDYPIIRLQLESMTKSITSAFMFHQEEIAKQVEAALKHEVERFDFEAEVRKRAHGALGSAVDRALNDHFQYGEGQRLVSRLVADAIARITPPEARRPRQSPDDDGCGVPGEGEV